MSRSNKILLGFFFVLLTIVIAEVFYYFFFQRLTSSQVSPTTDAIQNTSVQSDETTVSSKTSSSSSQVSYREIFASFDNYFENVGRLADEKILTLVLVTEEYEGLITNIQKNRGEFIPDLPEVSLKYDTSLTMVDLKKSSGQKTFYFTIGDLALAEISQQINNNEQKKLTFQDLKPDDHIILKQSSNMLSDPRDGLISLEITRINN